MAYALLIVEDAADRRSRPPEQGRRYYERMQRFVEELQARGVYRASEALRSDAHAARLELRGGKPLVTDGPFVESKEIVGGFFLLDCRTRDEAVAIAAECPAAEWATIEVREVGPCWS